MAAPVLRLVTVGQELDDGFGETVPDGVILSGTKEAVALCADLIGKDVVIARHDEVARLRSILADIWNHAATATQTVVPEELRPQFFHEIREMARPGSDRGDTCDRLAAMEAERDALVAVRDRLIIEVREEACAAGDWRVAARLNAIADRGGKP